MTPPVEKHSQGRSADTADLSTTLRSGRDDKGEGGASGECGGRTGAAFITVENIPREGPLTPQISPLRCAPVEMTKGRAALPGSVVAEKDPFFITLGGPQ